MDPLDELYRQEASQAQHIARLIVAFIRGRISPAEHDELDQWIASSDEHMRLFEELTDEKQQTEWVSRVEGIDTEAALRRARSRAGLSASHRPLRYWLWAAAACLVLVAGVWILDAGKRPVVAPLAVVDTDTIVPGGNRATLTLADGKVIDLSSAKNGVIYNGEGSHVNKPGDGELAYETGERGEGPPPPLHTLSTPPGGQFKVILPDGTQVWLNATSSLQYPVYFAGGSREVTVTGEAYFEVSKDASRPFKVHLPDSSVVEVLGTHFDVESYAGARVTLLEGKVKVRREKREDRMQKIEDSREKIEDRRENVEVILKPGEQAFENKDRREKIEVSSLNQNQIEEVMGWKDGLFVFHEATIQEILPQLERWYQVKVVDQTGGATWHFTATIERKENLDKVLNLLSRTGHIHFKVKDKTLYALP